MNNLLLRGRDASAFESEPPPRPSVRRLVVDGVDAATDDSPQEVIRAFVAFTQQRKPMAAFVAAHFAEWQYWDAGPAYVELLKSNTIADPASRLVVLNYLSSSPRADAKAAVRALTVSSR
jgi:hypothetical protein